MSVLARLQAKLPGPLGRAPVAAALAILAALAAVLLGGGAKLAGRQAAAEAAFYEGEHSPASDLQARLSAAANVTTAAGRVDGADPALLAAVDKAVAAVDAAGGIAAKAAADRELETAVYALYDQASPLADAASGDLLAGALAEFDSRGNILRAGGYNETARRFNELLDRQPAKLFAALFGIEEAEYYQ